MLVCFSSREYVAYLLASLYRPTDTFLIHCDERAPHELKAYIGRATARFANIIQMETQNYSWAGYSHVDLCLKAIAAGLELGQPWSHIIFLSEQHLPLKGPEEIESYLRIRKSVALLSKSTDMLPEAQADIRNRFGAIYRELPGVGCFATDAIERDEEFYENIYHGSNWIAVHRDHCAFLLMAEKNGQFDLFKTIVHAEEMAIPTILAQLRSQIDNSEVTLVAAPHLVDNHGLVMTEDLFRSAETSHHLFIRKRTKRLSALVDSHIRRRHFNEDVYRLSQALPFSTDVALISEGQHQGAKTILEQLITSLQLRCSGQILTTVVDPAAHEFPCRIHLVTRLPAMPLKRSVRVLSQNLRDFKVCLIEATDPGAVFSVPLLRDGNLYSTARVKINDLFGYRDVLPMSLEEGGFVSLDCGQSIEKVAILVETLLMEAVKLDSPPNTVGVAKQVLNIRAERVNQLIRISGSKRYLEVGVAFGDTFFDVDAPYKAAVDPNFQFDFGSKANAATCFYPLTSDIFFEQYNGEPFDMIYLDGLHTYDQTTRDFFNSFRVAHAKTIWLFDDTVPNDAHSALPNQGDCYHRRAMEGNPDASWMGDVYKTVLLIARLLPFFSYKTFEGHGQTVVWRSKAGKIVNPSCPSLEAIEGFSFWQLMDNRSLLNLEADGNIYDAIRAELFS